MLVLAVPASAKPDVFAQRLREAMAILDMSNAELAAAVGVHPVTVSKWRSGMAVEPHRMPALAAALDVREQWLLTGRGPRERGPEAVREPLHGYEPDALFTRAIREREKEVELELVRMGATDIEVRGFSQSIRGNPLLVAAFSGGAPTKLTNEQVLQLFEGAASGYKRIVEMMVAEREAEARRR
jgi:transcriptional regulator with XRE-family HTH domain